MNLPVQTTPFWIVVSEENGLSFRPYKHQSESSAFTEAERLARGTSCHFLVFECKGFSRKTDVSTTKFDGIPF